jgi:integrase
MTDAEMLAGTWIDPEAGRVPLTEYASAWIVERPGLRPKTIQLYRYLLRCHVASGFGTIGDITETEVRRWRADLLAAGVSPVTAAKAYRLLKAIMATAAEDSLIRRNPCRVKGAGTEQSPERPLLTIAQVYALAHACGPRYRPMILLACFGGLRWGELAALRRRDIDAGTATARITRQLTEARGQPPFFAPPKPAAGRRQVIQPATVMAEIQHHLDTHTAADADALLFTSPRGELLRHSNFRHGTCTPGTRHNRPDQRPLPRPPPRRQPPRGRSRGQPPRADGAHGPRQQPRRADLPALHSGPAACASRRHRTTHPQRPGSRIVWHECGTPMASDENLERSRDPPELRIQVARLAVSSLRTCEWGASGHRNTCACEPCHVRCPDWSALLWCCQECRGRCGQASAGGLLSLVSGGRGETDLVFSRSGRPECRRT